jgi:hypothetical protein
VTGATRLSIAGRSHDALAVLFRGCAIKWEIARISCSRKM